METATRETKLKAFDKLFKDFVSDLCRLRPNDLTLSMLKAGIYVLPTEMLVKQYVEVIGDYTHEIYAKDEHFFINILPNEIHDSFAADELKRVSKIWKHKETTDEDKEAIWKYVIMLTKLGISLVKTKKSK